MSVTYPRTEVSAVPAPAERERSFHPSRPVWEALMYAPVARGVVSRVSIVTTLAPLPTAVAPLPTRRPGVVLDAVRALVPAPQWVRIRLPGHDSRWFRPRRVPVVAR